MSQLELPSRLFLMWLNLILRCIVLKLDSDPAKIGTLTDECAFFDPGVVAEYY